MLDAVQTTYGVAALLVAVLGAPFVEELMFRFGLFDAIERHMPGRSANVLQALIFALNHDAWQMWPSLFTIGWLAGRMRRRSGSRAAGMLFHAAWNAGVVLVMILAR